MAREHPDVPRQSYIFTVDVSNSVPVAVNIAVAVVD